MFGTSGKHGRGGGVGGGRGAKRIHSPFTPAPPLHRPVGGASSGRLSIGGSAAGRNRQSTPAASAPAPSAPEETFSLVTEDPLAFAMIIRLAPDLVDEIKRVEAQGGTAKIKFDSNANNPSGNVIDVGGKDFRFTWSREPGDLCDIYEERQSGEEGNGLLVESGCAWRKLNVQRILDESTMNHVKMRSEEAERKLKSRKAIVLDHGNPSVKNQLKTTLAAAAVDMNPRRMPPFKQKKEPPFKKRKVESTQVVPLKSSFKPGLPSTTVPKSRLSVSPLPSPPEQSGPSASPFGTGNLTHGHSSGEDAIAPQLVTKEDIASSEKEKPSRAANGAAQEASAHKVGLGATPMDLQSHLIMLLMENRKGMSLKALEKAIGDTIPNCTRKIEPIIKKIATFQAPGRYFLKPGVGLDSLKKPLSESGSSPECIHGQTPVPDQTFPEKATTEGFEKPDQLSSILVEKSNEVGKTNVQQSSPDLFGDKKLSDNSEGQAGSSSESGSDSDSESESSDSGSDSGSQSRSASKSRSPAGSGSGSSSDSESDGSSSSKEGSDVDVDIMTSDDDKEAEHKSQPPELKISDSPIPWKTFAVPEQNEIDEDKQHAPDTAEIDKDLGNDGHENEMVDTDLEPKKGQSRSSETIPFSPDRDKKQVGQQMSHLGKIANEMHNTVKDVIGQEQSYSFDRVSKSKSKSDIDVKNFEVKPESAKRSKLGMASQQQAGRRRDALFSDIPHHFSPDRLNQDSHEDHAIQMNDTVGKDGNSYTGSQKGHSVAMPGRSISDVQQSGQRSLDISARGKALDRADRSNKNVQNLGRGFKLSEKSSSVPDESNGSAFRSMHAHGKGSMPRDKMQREKQNEDSCAYEKLMNKNVRESVNGDRSSLLSNMQYRNHVEQVGKAKDEGHMTHPDMGSLPMGNCRSDVEKSPVINGRGALLRRELSDLELGELRESRLGEETQVAKFERKSSFKLSENKPSASDNWNSDFSKGRTLAKASQDSRKQPSPINSRIGFPCSQEGPFKIRAPEDDAEDSLRPQQKAALSQPQQFPGVDRADNEVGLQSNKFMDIGGKSRKNEAYTSKGVGPEGCGSTHKKAPTSAPQQNEPKHTGQAVATNTIKESKSLKFNSVADVTNRRNGSFWMESNSSSHKRRESSSDEDSCSYSKYDKDEPELKGQIKDFSQYEEYVQEYLEKYGSYCSLNNILDTYRNDFHKLGRDLELAKDRDMEGYYNIIEQLKEMYRQSGARHKRLKKIFIVLHEELKHLKQRMKDFALAYTKE